MGKRGFSYHLGMVELLQGVSPSSLTKLMYNFMAMPESELLKQHIKDTTRRFDELRKSLDRFEGKLDDLSEFKVSVITTSRVSSLVISALCGFITFVGAVLLQPLITRWLGN